MKKEEAIALCKKHMHRYVMIKTTDGSMYDGIVESVDEENVYLAVPGEIGPMSAAYPAPMYAGMGHYGGHAYSPYCGAYDYRQFGAYPGYGYGSYGYPGYGRRRRFQRLVLPLAIIAALSLLPYY